MSKEIYIKWKSIILWLDSRSVLEKIFTFNKFVDKNPKIIRRISDSPLQEQKYKKQNKNKNYWNNHEEIKNTHFFKLILVAKSFRVFYVLIKSIRVLCITRKSPWQYPKDIRLLVVRYNAQDTPFNINLKKSQIK